MRQAAHHASGMEAWEYPPPNPPELRTVPQGMALSLRSDKIATITSSERVERRDNNLQAL